MIAGDVYDRRIPCVEAMKLFDHLLTELALRDKYVFVIPGNHDSPARLSYTKELLALRKIYIAGELKREMMQITVPGKETASGREADVTFHLMPYLFPKLVSDESVLGRDDLNTYDEAVRAYLEAQDIDKTKCNVLVAHQNVLANGTPPEHSESETIIGGLGEIEVSAFDGFDYVALGHIHNAQKIGRECVRYSGCPLYYDFSEINRDKSLTLVNISSKGEIEIERVPIPLKHTLLQESGSLKELLQAGSSIKDKEKYYIQCVLTDRHVPPRAMEQLREVYGDSLVNVKRALSETKENAGERELLGEAAALSLPEQFRRFYQEMSNELLDENQEMLVKRILEQQSRRSGDYYTDAKSIPREDLEELLK